MKLYAIHFNRPDFIEIQYQLSKQFNHDLVVVNNGRNPKIKDISLHLNIEYLETDNTTKNGSVSHGESINQILDKIDMSKDWGLIDHDMFITSEIIFDKYDVITIKQTNVPQYPYFWPGMLLCKAGVDLSDIDFVPGVGIPADTGSDTFRKVNQYNVGWCDIEYYGEKNNRLYQDSNIITKHLLNNELIGYHYLNGSNWTGGNAEYNKNQILKDLLNI